MTTRVYLSLFLLTGILACTPADNPGGNVPKRDINQVMEAHSTELMDIPGVIGVAIGELEDKTPCIQVLVIEKTAEIERRVPKMLEGHPTKIVVTGLIKPLENESSPG